MMSGSTFFNCFSSRSVAFRSEQPYSLGLKKFMPLLKNGFDLIFSSSKRFGHFLRCSSNLSLKMAFFGSYGQKTISTFFSLGTSVFALTALSLISSKK